MLGIPFYFKHLYWHPYQLARTAYDSSLKTPTNAGLTASGTATEAGLSIRYKPEKESSRKSGVL